jgi:hypothetical protein
MKRTFGRRINDWLDEPDGEQFVDGKWRFWLPAVLGFSILNAVLTVMIFRETASANYLTPALLAASAIVGWIAIGCLHYSDAKRGRMARGVSALDSATLLFVIGHFCFLVYILGHSWILRGAEADYKIAVAAYDEKAGKVSEDNARIADAATKIAELETKRARIENDTAYQSRKAAEAGAKIRTAPRSGSAAAGLATSPVELAPPPKAPDDAAAAFLTRWDAWVRITNFGELILAALTLIFIRNWTAKTNSPRADDEFPREIEVENRLPAKREKFSPKKGSTKDYGPSNSEGLNRLREALKDISFRLHKRSFKARVKGDAVWILMVKARFGTQETIHSARAKLGLLDDAVKMERTAFRERLERFLKENEFEL